MSCRYFCKNQKTGQYDCCDGGSPNNNSDVSSTTNPSQDDDNQGVTVTVGADYIPGELHAVLLT